MGRVCESKLGADALGPPWAEVRDEVCLARAPHGCPPLLSAARPGRVPTAASQGRLWRPLRPDTRQVTGQLPGHRRARPRVHEPRESQLARLTGGTRSAVPGDREVTGAGERGGGGGRPSPASPCGMCLVASLQGQQSPSTSRSEPAPLFAAPGAEGACGEAGWGQDAVLPPTVGAWGAQPGPDQPPEAPLACPLGTGGGWCPRVPLRGQHQRPPWTPAQEPARPHALVMAAGATPAAGELRGAWRPLLCEPALSEKAPRDHSWQGACPAHTAPWSRGPEAHTASSPRFPSHPRRHPPAGAPGPSRDSTRSPEDMTVTIKDDCGPRLPTPGADSFPGKGERAGVTALDGPASGHGDLRGVSLGWRQAQPSGLTQARLSGGQDSASPPHTLRVSLTPLSQVGPASRRELPRGPGFPGPRWTGQIISAPGSGPQ